MAFKITYTYKKQAKEIGYANDKFNSIYDAIAAAEGLDLSSFHAMEAQLAQGEIVNILLKIKNSFLPTKQILIGL